MDECRSDTGVSMATQEAVGVAMAHRTHPIFSDLVIARVIPVKGGGVMQDVRHSIKQHCNQNHLSPQSAVELFSSGVFHESVKHTNTISLVNS